jgi:type IV fimbrial biogenesis protein FimT
MCQQNERGFTLIESLTALAVAGSLTLVALPSFSSVVQKQQVVDAANEFNLALALGRSEALARGERVGMVPIDSSGWGSGWLLFVDRNDNGRSDPGEEAIRVFELSNRNVSFHAWGAPATARMSFTPQGFVRRAGGNGLALGGIAVRAGDHTRAICFAAARTRIVVGDSCG